MSVERSASTCGAVHPVPRSDNRSFQPRPPTDRSTVRRWHGRIRVLWTTRPDFPALRWVQSEPGGDAPPYWRRMDTVLDVDDLSVSFGGTTILRNPRFQVTRIDGDHPDPTAPARPCCCALIGPIQFTAPFDGRPAPASATFHKSSTSCATCRSPAPTSMRRHPSTATRACRPPMLRSVGLSGARRAAGSVRCRAVSSSACSSGLR